MPGAGKLRIEELYSYGITLVVVGVCLIAFGYFMWDRVPPEWKWVAASVLMAGLIFTVAGAAIMTAGAVFKHRFKVMEISQQEAQTIIIVSLVAAIVASVTILTYLGILTPAEFIEVVKYLIAVIVSLYVGYRLGRMMAGE
jgi:amino acid transporter